MEPARTSPPTSPPSAPVATSFLARMRNRDHTRGSVLGSLAVLALPSILMSLVGGALFQLFDLKFVGALGATAIAVVGMTNQTVRQAGFLMLMGTSIATQSMIARLIGEGREAGAEHVAGQAFFVGGVLALTFALVGGLFPAQLLGWVTSDPIALATGTPYVRLVFLLMAGQIFVPLFASILSAAGETTTPLLITLLSAPVSVFAEWCLIFGHFGLPELGLTGVPWGMATGSVVSLGISFWALFTGRVRIHVRVYHLIPDGAVLGRLLATAWQPAMQMVSRTLIVFYFMWLAGHIGTEVQAAYTVGLRLEMIAFMVAFPLANACATLVGQNLGAGDVARAWRSIRVGMAVEVVVLWAFAAAILLFRSQVVGFFTGDPEVSAIASDYLWYAAIGLSYYGVYFIAFRALQAAGDMTAPMLISIGCATLLGAPLAWYLAVVRTDLGASGMWMANVAYGVVNTTLTVGWLLGGRWTHGRPIARPEGGAGAGRVG